MLLMGVLLLGAFIPCFVQPMAAQEYRATVRGVITDPTHAVVPGAKVTLRNINTAVEKVMEADPSGFYIFSFVIPGSYNVTVEAPGFQKYVQADVPVPLTGDVTVNAVLTLGAVTQTVEVTAAVAQVQFNTSTMQSTVTGSALKDLPVLAMNPFTLALLNPAVVNDYWDVSHRYPFYMWSDSLMEVGGNTNGRNELLLDGVTLNISARGSYAPPMDGVQEMTVQQNPMDAEYGFSGGAAINMSVKSGTNAIHGTAYYFGRNPATDAMSNRISRSLPIFRQSSWGGTIGNPLIKNKLFNFFAYEQWKVISPNSREMTMPTDAERTGDFSGALTPENKMRVIYDPTTTVFNPVTSTSTRTPISCLGVANVICGNQIDPTAKLIMPYVWGPNTTPDSPDGLNNLKVTYAWWDHYWNISDRTDYNISDKWRMYGRFSKFQCRLDNANWGNSIATPSDNGGVMDALNAAMDVLWMASPRTTVDFRFGSTYDEDEYTSTLYMVKPSVWAGLWPTNPWYTAMINPAQGLYFPYMGFTGIGSGQLGAEFWFSVRGRSHNPVVNVTHEVGKHHLKFGWQFRYSYDQNITMSVPGGMQFNSVDTAQNFLLNVPTETGDMWASFLSGVIDSGSAIVSPRVDMHQQQWTLYAQDDLKLSSRITLNLGLRWERETAPADELHRLVQKLDMTHEIPELQGTTIWGPQQLAALPNNALTLQNMPYSFTGGMIYTSASNPRMYDAPWHTFLPRAGIAIRLDDKTALRMGYSRYALQWLMQHAETGGLPLNGYSSTSVMFGPLEGTPRAYLANPFPSTGSYPNEMELPTGNTLGAYQDLGNSIASFWNGADMKTSINDRLNITLQRQEPHRIAMEATFFIMFQHQLPMSYNINQMDPMLAYTYKGLTTKSVANPFYNLLPANIMPGVLRTQATVPLSQLLRPYPQYGDITEQDKRTYPAHYYAMQLSASRPMFNGYTFLASYNYSHENDGQYYDDIDTYNNKLTMLDRGQPRHNFRVSGTYELPFGKGRRFMGNAPRAVDAVLGGWATSHIFWWRSGNLLTFPTTGVICPPGENIPKGYWFNANCLVTAPAYTIPTAPLHYEGLRGPRYWDLDSTLVKNFRITERVNLEFRMEMYNLLNMFQPSDPNVCGTTVCGSTVGGLSTWMANGNYGREMQYTAHIRF
jgi:hypothetical protein